MKSVKYIFALAAAVLMLNACSEKWLSQEPEGATVTEDQFKNRDDMLQGSVYGIYAMMYQYSDHDEFGFRSIDMYGDINCGDMAMKSWSYGWFQNDEMGQTYQRRAYFWSYYYDMIRQCNKAILNIKQVIDVSKIDDDEYVKKEAAGCYYYGEALAMRGWAYSNLIKWFCLTPTQLIMEGTDLDNKLALPIYTEEVVEKDSIMGAKLSSAADVYRRIEEDLSTAIRCLSLAESAGVTRSLKHEVNSDVARLILAYAYLNKEDWVNAEKWALEFINNTAAPILPNDKVLTTGFANIDEPNWLWGQDVNVVTSTQLASFFGQVDVFSYSYAWAGDVKGIDENLYKEVTDSHKWDIRSQWWNNLYSKHKQYQFAPDGKFYSPSIKNANNYQSLPTGDEIDKVWLCDQVYMRAELGYLIAAEAQWWLGQEDAGKLTESMNNLIMITDQRQNDATDANGYYSAWKASLSDPDVLFEEIRYNWRVELWGEGYGMQTFRRFGEQVTLGSNHKTRANKQINPNGQAERRQFTMEIPSGEQYYNPYLRDITTLQTQD